jgi:hypothetical protein
MSSQLAKWQSQLKQMQDCPTVADLLTQFGPPHHKVPQDGFEIWHYPLGLESCMVYSIHAAVWPDQTRQTYLYFEPASESTLTRRPRASLKKRMGNFLVVMFLCSAYFLFVFAKSELQRVYFEKHLKHQVAPEALRTWALGILQAHDAHKVYDNGHITNSHPALRGTFIPPATVWWYSASPNDTEFVRVSYGSGFVGHWGVEIGPTNRAIPPSSNARQYSSWASGIYFFKGQ